MARFKQIVCKYCGETTTVSTLRKADYCDKIECVKKAKYEQSIKSQKKIQASKKQLVVDLAKRQLVVNLQNAETHKKDTIQRSINNKATENLDISDIIEISRQLGAIRYNLIEMLKTTEDKIAKCEKSDEYMVHAFEFEELSKEQVWEQYLRTKEYRTKRRELKYRRAIIKTILDNITIKAPNKFVVTAINGLKETRNFEQYIEELKKDNNLFS